MDKINEIWNGLSGIEQSGIAIVGMVVVYIFCRFIILHYFEKIASATTNDFDDRFIQFIKQFFWMIALFITVVIVLKINKIEVSPLLAGAGIFGVALGFAAKETLADILSGIFLISDRPIRIGDRVKIENIGRHWGAWGDVVDIGLRRTRICNTDGVIVSYPNSQLSNSIINNFSIEDKPVRVRVRFQVGYCADIALAKSVATEAISSVDEVMTDTVQMVTRSLWDDSKGHQMSGVLLEGRYRIKNVRKRTAVRSAVLDKILQAMQTHKIPLAAHPILINK